MTVIIYAPRDTNVATIKSISGEYALCILPGVRRLIACHASQASVARWTPDHIGSRLSFDHICTRERHTLIGARLTPKELS